MNWTEILKDFSKLSKTDKFKLFDATKVNLFGSADPEIETLATNLRETRWDT